MRRLMAIPVALVVALLMSASAGAQQTPYPVPYTFDVTTDPASLIGAYYNAITQRDYARAYGYWQPPRANQTLAQFAAGFADTVSAGAFVGVPYPISGAAGSAYASLPTLVVAQRTDGSQVYYAGCFTVRKSNVPVGNAVEPDPNWYLQSARLLPMASAQAALARLAQPCVPGG